MIVCRSHTVMNHTGDAAKTGWLATHNTLLHLIDSSFFTFLRDHFHSRAAFRRLSIIFQGKSKKSDPEKAWILRRVLLPLFEELEEYSSRIIIVKSPLQGDNREFLVSFPMLRQYAADLKELREMFGHAQLPMSIVCKTGCCNCPNSYYGTMWLCPITGEWGFVELSDFVRLNNRDAPEPADEAGAPEGSSLKDDAHYWGSAIRWPLSFLEALGLNCRAFIGKGKMPVTLFNWLPDESKGNVAKERENLSRLLLACFPHFTNFEWERFVADAEALLGSLAKTSQKRWKQLCPTWRADAPAIWQAPNSPFRTEGHFTMLLNAIFLSSVSPNSGKVARKIDAEKATKFAFDHLESIAANHFVDINSMASNCCTSAAEYRITDQFRAKLDIYLTDAAVALESCGYTLAQALALDERQKCVVLEHIVNMRTVTILEVCRNGMTHNGERPLKFWEDLIVDFGLHMRGTCTGGVGSTSHVHLKRTDPGKQLCDRFREDVTNMEGVQGISKQYLSSDFRTSGRLNLVKSTSGRRTCLRKLVENAMPKLIERMVCDFYLPFVAEKFGDDAIKEELTAVSQEMKLCREALDAAVTSESPIAEAAAKQNLATCQARFDNVEERLLALDTSGRKLPSCSTTKQILHDVIDLFEKIVNPADENLEGKTYAAGYPEECGKLALKLALDIMREYGPAAAEWWKRQYPHILVAHSKALMTQHSATFAETQQQGCEKMMENTGAMMSCTNRAGGSRAAKNDPKAKKMKTKKGAVIFVKRVGVAERGAELCMLQNHFYSHLAWERFVVPTVPEHIVKGCRNMQDFFYMLNSEGGFLPARSGYKGTRFRRRRKTDVEGNSPGENLRETVENFFYAVGAPPGAGELDIAEQLNELELSDNSSDSSDEQEYDSSDDSDGWFQDDEERVFNVWRADGDRRDDDEDMEDVSDDDDAIRPRSSSF